MEENKLPPGFRFHPTDEELINFYLSHKVSDSGFTSKAIVDVDLNKCEPWDLPAKASMGVKEWYFFSLKDRKYPTGLRTNRATEAGYWKTTGKDKEIVHGDTLIGMKKTLVFYRGRAPKGEKTNWVMHEYRLHNTLSYKPTKEEWVVCRIFEKNAIVKMARVNSPLHASQDSHDETNTMPNDFGDIEFPNMNTMCINSSSGFISNYLSSLGNYSSLVPSQSWLTPNLNLNSTVNSLLLKALHLRNSYPPRDHQASSTLDYSFLEARQGLPLGIDLSSNLPSSSSANTLLESTPQQHLQQQLFQEQPFNMDSMW